MSGKTSIQWTAGDDGTPGYAWNPVVGCTRVSAGCDHCYAFQLHDQRHIAWKRGRWDSAPEQYHKPFSKVQLLEDRLEDPLHWRKPRRVFVNSVSDLFHPDVPFAFIDRVFAVMARAPQHTFQILTKRPERMREYLGLWKPSGYRVNGNAYEAITRSTPETDATLIGPLFNVWLGVSVEHQAAADERIPLLLQTPASVRFLSCEPLLGSVDLTEYLQLTDTNQMTDERWETHGWGYDINTGGFVGVAPRGSIPYNPQPGLDWVIIGGESGPHARLMHLAWAESLIAQCRAAEIALFMKQLGTGAAKAYGLANRHGGDIEQWVGPLSGLRVREFPTARADVAVSR